MCYHNDCTKLGGGQSAVPIFYLDYLLYSAHQFFLLQIYFRYTSVKVFYRQSFALYGIMIYVRIVLVRFKKVLINSGNFKPQLTSIGTTLIS